MVHQQDFNVVRGLAMRRHEFGLGSSADDKASIFFKLYPVFLER